MESVLVLTHTDETHATLSKGSLEAITTGIQLAARLGSALTVGIVCSDADSLAKDLPLIDARWLVVSGEPFAQPRYATDAAACEALCCAATPTIVLVPQSARFARIMAAVAYRMHGSIDTHITAIGGVDGVQASRCFYRQRIESTLTRAERPWFLCLDAGTHAAYGGQTGPAQAEQIAVVPPSTRTTVLGSHNPEKDTDAVGSTHRWETIRPDAGLLFVAGAGWTKKQPDGQIHAEEACSLILDFLRASGASLGSSKSLVDQGGEGEPVLPFLTHLNQVGQTGSTPRHAKGLSTCCHGEEPHVVGWRFVGERRAISLDPNCGWTRGKADVVYVADAFQVIARLNKLLA
jgi:electron transfer flavoprotein alpha subunit